MTLPRCPVLIYGDPRWSRVLMGQLALAGVEHRAGRSIRDAVRERDWAGLMSLVSSRVLHLVSVPIEEPFLVRWSRRQGKRLVAHWIGSDVLNLAAHVQQHGKVPPALTSSAYMHLADSPALQTELSGMGIKAEVVHLLPESIESELMPLPGQPCVLSYWGDRRARFYGSDHVLEMARRLPDVPFLIAGATGSGLADVPPNVSFLGNVTDMESVYRRSTVLCRLVEHDSVSVMVLEALARGRYVLYSGDFPCTTRAGGLEQTFAALRELLGRREPNVEGARFVSESFSRRQEAAKLRDVYMMLLS